MDTATASNQNSDATNEVRMPAAEAFLRDQLIKENHALRGISPILNHMLAYTHHGLLSDALIANLQGIFTSLARQLLEAHNPKPSQVPDFTIVEQLAQCLASDSIILSYCYTQAMEGYLTQNLHQQAYVDPVLSPLLQELVASDNPSTAEIAMSALAAQSRFIQSHRRMQLPISELPAELFFAILKLWKDFAEKHTELNSAVDDLQANYDEASNRVGLFARLISSMGDGAIAALNLEHAGLALFSSALSIRIDQPRHLTVIACHEDQSARLMLSLCAAGLTPEAIERQFTLLQLPEKLPYNVLAIDPERAMALLSGSNAPYDD